MSDAVKLALIDNLLKNLPAILIALASAFAILWKLRSIHSMVNSRLTELVNATRAAARAEGIAEGAATEKAVAAATLAGEKRREPDTR